MGEAATQDATGYVAGTARRLDAATIAEAVAGVMASARAVKSLSSADRAAICDAVAMDLRARKTDLAAALAAESGYLTLRDMLLEVDRTIDVFTLSAAAARTGFEETIPVDAAPRGRDTMGIVKREPIGPVLGITAFNGPMLIAAHKVAPAIVAGAPIVLKPSPRVPNGTVLLAEAVVRAGWPAAAIAVLPLDNAGTEALIRDPRLPLITFTGGDFGWTIKEMVPRKRVHLELGGVGAVLVAADADLDLAAEQCAIGGFVRSGQACLAVQRIYVERAAYPGMVERLGARIGALVVGDVAAATTDIGPLVSEQAAGHVEALIADALAKGARRICGGEGGGAVVRPTLLADATPAMAVMRREAFGPVVAIAAVDSLAEAVAEANATGGAIHVGLFTRNIDTALNLADEIRAGGVIINGSSAFRVDQMPYGGVGTSGFGREGIRSMVLEYTEPKTILIRRTRG